MNQILPGHAVFAGSSEKDPAFRISNQFSPKISSFLAKKNCQKQHILIIIEWSGFFPGNPALSVFLVYLFIFRRNQLNFSFNGRDRLWFVQNWKNNNISLNFCISPNFIFVQVTQCSQQKRSMISPNISALSLYPLPINRTATPLLSHTYHLMIIWRIVFIAWFTVWG